MNVRARITNIYIPIEITARELEYKVWIATKLAKKGFKVYIGDKSSINHYMSFDRNYYYIDKGFHEGTSLTLWKRIKDRGGKIFSLDEEGAVDFKNGRVLKSRYAQELFSSVDHVFMWGENQYKAVASKFKASLIANKITVSGHPRFQLLATNYSKYQDEAKSKNILYGKYILINTNMGFGNNVRGAPFVIKNYGSRIPEIQDVIDNDQKKISLLIDYVNNVLDKTGHTVVIRPHPEESAEVYLKVFSGRKVRVVYEGSVVPWIIGSIAVIHFDCTTAIESVMLNKPAISISSNVFNNEIMCPVPVMVSHKADSFQEFISLINHCEARNLGTTSESERVLEEYFSFKKNSIDIIVSKIVKISENVNKNIEKGGLYNLIPILVQSIGFGIFRFFYLFTRYKSCIDPLIANKLKGLDYSCIKTTIDNLCTIGGNVTRVKLKREGGRIFSISNDNKV